MILRFPNKRDSCSHRLAVPVGALLFASVALGAPPCDMTGFGKTRVKQLVKQYAQDAKSDQETGLSGEPQISIQGEVLVVSYVEYPIGGNSSWPVTEMYACSGGAMKELSALVPAMQYKGSVYKSTGPEIEAVGGTRYKITYTIWTDSDSNCCPSKQNVILADFHNGAFRIVRSVVQASP